MYFPISVNGSTSSSFSNQKSWRLVLLTSLFWWSIMSTFELYPEFDYFSLCPLPLPPSQSHHHFSPNYCSSLPASLLTSLQSICHTQVTMIFLKCHFVPFLLKALQWFSICLGIKLKFFMVSYKTLYDKTPLPMHEKLYAPVSHLYLPHSSANKPSMFPPQGLCIPCFLCLQNLSPSYPRNFTLLRSSSRCSNSTLAARSSLITCKYFMNTCENVK